jgi:hypothetical protein
LWPSHTFHFSTRIRTSTHSKVFNVFFALFLSRCPAINLQFSIISKWLAKHISTQVSLKIAIRKRHVYIDIVWPWIWNQCFYLRIWNDDGTKMIVLPSFRVATGLNSQNTNKAEFSKQLWHINLFMNIGISNWHNWRFELT